MSEPVPWQCPACRTWLAPHVTEHRCDPPQAGVTALPYVTGPAGSTGTSISTATLPGTVTTVNVSASPVTGREVLDYLQRHYLEQSSRNWNTGRAA